MVILSAHHFVPLLLVTAPVVVAIERALSRSCLSKKALAVSMGESPAQLARQLSGEQHIPLDRLDTAPAEFRQVFPEELAQAWGLRPIVTAAQVMDLFRRST
jgi:hypothetical protein